MFSLCLHSSLQIWGGPLPPPLIKKRWLEHLETLN